MQRITKWVLAGAILAVAPMAMAASSKFAAQVNDVTCAPDPNADGVDNQNWMTVLNTTIRTPNKKDLLIGASFETGLYTQTQVKGKGGEKDSASAEATLEVRVLVDGGTELPVDVEPDEVVYDRRAQTLSAVFGGVIESCEDTDDFSVVDGVCVDETPGEDTPDGVLTVQCECVVTDEEIELILDTMGAHHFNFIAKNLGPGDHAVEVQTRIGTSSDSGNGSASAFACVGRGSLSVEEVRATNNPDGIDFQN